MAFPTVRALLLCALCACRRDPEPTVTTVTPAPVASSAPAPVVSSEVSYADLCARSTPKIPSTAAVSALYDELRPRLDLRATQVLGALSKDGVDPHMRHEILRMGATEQGLKTCPLANVWETWAKSDAGVAP